MYTYCDNNFTKTNSFQLTFTSEYDIPVSLGSDVIYVANQDKHCIHVLSLDGTELAKHGRFGHYVVAGMLDYPHAASSDSKDNLLVCDTGHHRLQMMTRNGKWQLLQCNNKITSPSDAVVVGDRIFVIGGGSYNCDPYIYILNISK